MKTLLWVFVAILFLELYSIFPYDDTERSMFLLSDMKITFQSWVDYAAKITAFCILLWQVRNLSTRYYLQLNVMLWLMVGYLFDYFIIYNEPFGYLYILNVRVWISYTLFMLLLIGLMLFTTWKNS